MPVSPTFVNTSSGVIGITFNNIYNILSARNTKTFNDFVLQKGLNEISMKQNTNLDFCSIDIKYQEGSL